MRISAGRRRDGTAGFRCDWFKPVQPPGHRRRYGVTGSPARAFGIFGLRFLGDDSRSRFASGVCAAAAKHRLSDFYCNDTRIAVTRHYGRQHVTLIAMQCSNLERDPPSIQPRLYSARHRVFDLDPVAGTHIRIVIPDGEMLRAAIVPKSDRMRFPAKTH